MDPELAEALERIQQLENRNRDLHRRLELEREQRRLDREALEAQYNPALADLAEQAERARVKRAEFVEAVRSISSNKDLTSRDKVVAALAGLLRS